MYCRLFINYYVGVIRNVQELIQIYSFCDLLLCSLQIIRLITVNKLFKKSKLKVIYTLKKIHTDTLLSDFRRIFFDEAGGQATAEATAFIIFVWDCVVCVGGWCWWLKKLPVLADKCGKCGDVCDSCAWDTHCSDRGNSHGPSLWNKQRQKNDYYYYVIIILQFYDIKLI